MKSQTIKYLLAVVVVVFGLLPNTSYSQGESAVPFLLIAPNSRASGLGESGTGMADDASAIFWNPAGLAFQTGQELSITHANWLPQFAMSDLFYEYLGYKGYYEELGGTIGANIIYLNLGEFIKTLSSGPEEVGRFKAYEFAVTAGYATKIMENLGVGVNLRFIRSALSPFGTEEEKGAGIANTVSFDIATMYKQPMMDGEFLSELNIGLNLANLGPKVVYVDEAQADPLPTNIRLGLGFNVYKSEFNNMVANIDLQRILVRRYTDGTSDNSFKALYSSWTDGTKLRKVTIGAGMEYWYGAPKLVAIRFGYFYEDPSFGNRKFLTFGAGIRYDIYGFDFSYLSAMEENHPLSETLRFTLMINWGEI
ncbi:MAG: type IX secretion system outer membrane channel protein PorV [Bacteroidota bacterium]|nr:type IX secretion system outer membrane channel protein PorV [Bacteroidota bacterium]